MRCCANAIRVICYSYYSYDLTALFASRMNVEVLKCFKDNDRLAEYQRHQIRRYQRVPYALMHRFVIGRQCNQIVDKKCSRFPRISQN